MVESAQPLTKPGAIAGWLLVFAAASTAFITQSLIGGGRIVLMPLYIYQQAVGEQAWPFAAALSLVFTAAVIGIVILVGRIGQGSFGRRRRGAEPVSGSYAVSAMASPARLPGIEGRRHA